VVQNSSQLQQPCWLWPLLGERPERSGCCWQAALGLAWGWCCWPDSGPGPPASPATKAGAAAAAAADRPGRRLFSALAYVSVRALVPQRAPPGDRVLFPPGGPCRWMPARASGSIRVLPHAVELGWLLRWTVHQLGQHAPQGAQRHLHVAQRAVARRPVGPSGRGLRASWPSWVNVHRQQPAQLHGVGKHRIDPRAPARLHAARPPGGK